MEHKGQRLAGMERVLTARFSTFVFATVIAIISTYVFSSGGAV